REESTGSAGEEEFEVEKVITHRRLANGTVEYKVRWKGYTKDDDTWENEDNLSASADLIADYNADRE
ncbi:Hypothetical predicted protein, partial [Olea europaea subsp. europaea]